MASLLLLPTGGRLDRGFISWSLPKRRYGRTGSATTSCITITSATRSKCFLLHSDFPAERVVVGPDIAAGERVQLFIPGNTFHTARLLGTGEWFLGGSTEWPGVVPTEDVEIGDADKLGAEHPEFAGDIQAIVASVRQQPAGGGPR